MTPRLQFLLLILAALLCTSCAHGTFPTPNAHPKIATRVLGFSSGRACDLFTLRCDEVLWRQSGWNRIEDTTEPVYVVVAGDGTACVIWETLVDTPVHNRYWNCESNWRTRSMR